MSNAPATTNKPAVKTGEIIERKAPDLGKPLETEQQVIDLMSLYKKAFAKVAAQHLDLDRMMRVALMTVSRSRILLSCTSSSLLSAFMLAAQMGLDFGAREAHLVPFKNNKTKLMEITLVPDYRGVIKLIRNSGEVSNVRARLVFKDDYFVHQEGMHPKLEHTPNYEGERNDDTIIGAYSCADFCDRDRNPTGYVDAHFMTIGHLMRIRDKSPAHDNGPWVTDFGEMCLKTVIKHHSKTLPYSVHLNTATILDNNVAMGKPSSIQLLGTGPDDAAIGMIAEGSDEEDQEQRKADLTPEKPTGSKLDNVVAEGRKAQNGGDTKKEPEKKSEPTPTLEQKRKAAEAEKKPNVVAEERQPQYKADDVDDGVDPETPMSRVEFDLLEGERLEHNVDVGEWQKWAKKHFDVRMLKDLQHKHFKEAMAWTVAGGKE